MKRLSDGELDCERAVAMAGLPPVPKSSCFFCPEMTPAEILHLQDTEPDLFARALAMEANAELRSVKGLGKHEYSWADLTAGRVPLAVVEEANARPGKSCMCSEDDGVL